MEGSSRAILFFDGECNLCNSTVQFIIRNDKKRVFRFSPLQSVSGKAAVDSLSATGHKSLNSVVLFYEEEYFVKSSAVLHVLLLLGGWWRLLYVFIIIPPPVRNFVYDIIARNRYKWFGKRAHCMVPTPELQERFIR